MDRRVRSGATEPFTIRGFAPTFGGFRERIVHVQGGRLASQGEGAGARCWSLNPRQAVLPGFHDHHTHLVGTNRPERGPALGRASTRAACLDAVRSWLDEHPGAGPVLGEGWDESAWGDPRPLTRSDLDRVSPERPLALRRVCGHLAAVNSAAWQLLEPSGPEADPATGTLVESLALGLSARWPAPRQDYEQGARAGQDLALREGVLGIDEMGRRETFQGFLDLESSGSLVLRVRHYFPISERELLLDSGLHPGAGTANVRVAGLKGFLDGSFGARTAAVAAPYRDRETTGMLLWETQDLLDAVCDGVAAGFAVALHAIGARAVKQALAVFERVRAGGAAEGALLRIEHAEELDAEDVERASAAGVVLSMQPNFTARWQLAEGMYEAALGRDRTRRLNPFRTASMRTTLLFGSDTMPFGPLFGLTGAFLHPAAEERLDLGPALRAYSRDGCAVAADGDALAPGSPADLVVVEAPRGGIDAALHSGEARVVWTCSEGATVYADPGADIPAFLGSSKG